MVSNFLHLYKYHMSRFAASLSQCDDLPEEEDFNKFKVTDLKHRLESNKDKIDVLLNSPLRVSDWLKTTKRRRVRADHFLDLSLRSAVFFSPLESLSSILSDIYRLIKIFP